MNTSNKTNILWPGWTYYNLPYPPVLSVESWDGSPDEYAGKQNPSTD